MSDFLTKKNEACGECLASGYGVGSMLDACYKKKLNQNNSILVVYDPNDLGSKWQVFAKK